MTGGGRGYCVMPADQVPQRPLGSRFWQGLRALNPLARASGGFPVFGGGAWGRGGGRGAGRGGLGRGRGGFGRGRGGW
jgi:hypothetical protein